METETAVKINVINCDAFKLEPGGAYVLEVQGIVEQSALFSFKKSIEAWAEQNIPGSKFLILSSDVKIKRQKTLARIGRISSGEGMPGRNPSETAAP